MAASEPVRPGPALAFPAKRHATRALAVRASPDGTSPVVASIEPATLVTVTGAVGPWRYVQSGRGREGWVDGTYLAGESTSAPPASRMLLPAHFRSAKPMATSGDMSLNPVPPLGIGAPASFTAAHR